MSTIEQRGGSNLEEEGPTEEAGSSHVKGDAKMATTGAIAVATSHSVLVRPATRSGYAKMMAAQREAAKPGDPYPTGSVNPDEPHEANGFGD